MIGTGQVHAVDEVKREVVKKDDDAANWAKAQKGLYVPLTTDIQKATKAVWPPTPGCLGSAVARETGPTRSS